MDSQKSVEMGRSGSENLVLDDEVFQELSPIEFRYPETNSINFDLDDTYLLDNPLETTINSSKDVQPDQTVVSESDILTGQAGESGLSDQERAILNSSPIPDQGIPDREMSFTNLLTEGMSSGEISMMNLSNLPTQVTYVNTLELHNQGSSSRDTFGIPTQESFTNILEFPNQNLSMTNALSFSAPHLTSIGFLSHEQNMNTSWFPYQGMNPFTILGQDMSELGSSSFPTLNINSTNLHTQELSRMDTFGIPTQESFTNTLELGSTQVKYLNTLELHNQGSSRMDTFGIPTQESFTNTLEFPNITTSGVPYQSPPVFMPMGDSYSNPKSILSSSDDEQFQEESDSTDGNDDGDSDSNPNSILRKSISKEMITQYFHMSLIKAARALNVGSTMLKRRCRELEIKRWPQRKVKSLETIISSLQRSGGSSGENVQERIRRLENERKRIEDNPDLPLEDDTIRLRQSLYKSSHRKRKQSDRDH